MIRSFRDRETAALFDRQRSAKLPSGIQRTALRKLRMLHNSQSLQDLQAPPANRLEKLSGDQRQSTASYQRNNQRICFV